MYSSPLPKILPGVQKISQGWGGLAEKVFSKKVLDLLKVFDMVLYCMIIAYSRLESILLASLIR